MQQILSICHVFNSKIIKDVIIQGNRALNAIDGASYNIGCVACLHAIASGSNIDYMIGVFGIKYSFGTMLRDTGKDGFLLPADQIFATVREVWAFQKSVAYQLIAEYNP